MLKTHESSPTARLTCASLMNCKILPSCVIRIYSRYFFFLKHQSCSEKVETYMLFHSEAQQATYYKVSTPLREIMLTDLGHFLFCENGMLKIELLVIIEVDHETNCSTLTRTVLISLCLSSSIAFCVYRLLFIPFVQSDKARGGTLRETPEWWPQINKSAYIAKKINKYKE